MLSRDDSEPAVATGAPVPTATAILLANSPVLDALSDALMGSRSCCSTAWRQCKESDRRRNEIAQKVAAETFVRPAHISARRMLGSYSGEIYNARKQHHLIAMTLASESI
jgi:hypothetical protein